jgi:putative membrane protein
VIGASTRALVLLVVVFHLMVWLAEAWLWMRPGIYELALARIAEPSALSLRDQASVLRTLFVNQGFYNLFLAGAGAVGLMLSSRGRAQAGQALMVYMCLTAVGAGAVLALTTRAYVGACLQALPAAFALVGLLARARAVPRVSRCAGTRVAGDAERAGPT